MNNISTKFEDCIVLKTFLICEEHFVYLVLRSFVTLTVDS